VILADTSVWIDHLRAGDDGLENALMAGSIFTHPFVIGEIALGNLSERKRLLESLRELPMADVATDDEVLRMIDVAKLFGRGIGYVDAHLLTAARLSGHATLWTRDRLLREAAHDLGLAHAEH
jgi:predicted nucleic acid-binding protein